MEAALASPRARAPAPAKLSISTKRDKAKPKTQNTLMVPGANAPTKFEAPSPMADTFNAMYSNVVAKTK
jgi:hypothetical protein